MQVDDKGSVEHMKVVIQSKAASYFPANIKLRNVGLVGSASS